LGVYVWVMELTLKQQDIEFTIFSQYPNLSKLESIKFIKSIFGSTACDFDINQAYKSLGK
jgi:hypothetical protein